MRSVLPEDAGVLGGPLNSGWSLAAVRCGLRRWGAGPAPDTADGQPSRGSGSTGVQTSGGQFVLHNT